MKPAKNKIKALSLRTFLSFLLIVVAIGGAALYYLATGYLRDFATEVGHTVADGTASGKQIEELQVLKGQLSQSQDLVDKANRLFSTSDAYQSQAVTDIQRYASASGVTISKTSFDVPVDQLSTGIGKEFIVTLSSPVSYMSLLRFLDGIEGNLPKLQVMNVGIGRLTNGPSGEVSIDEINITIAVR